MRHLRTWLLARLLILLAVCPTAAAALTAAPVLFLPAILRCHVRHFNDVDWADPLLYHLVLKTAALTEQEAVRLVLSAAPTEGDLPSIAQTESGDTPAVEEDARSVADLKAPEKPRDRGEANYEP